MKRINYSHVPRFTFDILVSLLHSMGLPIHTKETAFIDLGPQLCMTYRKYSMDSVVIAENMLLKIYDRFLPTIGQHDWIIDIGGHIGTTTIHLAQQFPNTHILCIEPYPASFALLQKNLLINHITSPPVFTENIAVAGDKATRTLHIDMNNTGGNSMLRIQNRGNQIDVPCTTLSELFDKYHITQAKFVKIDCEGAEYEIILSSPIPLLQRIQSMIIEYTPGGQLHDLMGKLHDSGFRTRLTHGFSNPLLRRFTTIPLCYAYR